MRRISLSDSNFKLYTDFLSTRSEQVIGYFFINRLLQPSSLIILGKNTYHKPLNNLGIKDISQKTGFTLLEIKVILFLVGIFVAGFLVKSFWISGNENPVNYDYSAQDSLFLSINTVESGAETKLADKDKNVDYKQEVLDFRKPEFNSGKSNVLPAEKSIDINKAGKNTFEELPGIGPKTADKIISYRKNINRFSKLEELMKVKGIGKTKFNKIKKYLYIEK